MTWRVIYAVSNSMRRVLLIHKASVLFYIYEAYILSHLLREEKAYCDKCDFVRFYDTDCIVSSSQLL